MGIMAVERRERGQMRGNEREGKEAGEGIGKSTGG